MKRRNLLVFGYLDLIVRFENENEEEDKVDSKRNAENNKKGIN